MKLAVCQCVTASVLFQSVDSETGSSGEGGDTGSIVVTLRLRHCFALVSLMETVTHA